MDDNKIVELIKKGDNDIAFTKLYKGFPAIQKFILSKGGSKSDAQDIFQEALIIFYRKACQSSFELNSKISTYLYSVSRFLWKDELIKRKKSDFVDFEVELEDTSSLQEILLKEEKLKSVEQVLKQIGEKCLKILTLFYFKKMPMKQIASEVDLRSEVVVKAQKYRCLQKAKNKLVASQSKNERDEK